MTIYRNRSGRPDPRGVIEMLPGLTDAPHYAFRSESDAAHRKWDISIPLTRIVKEMEAEGWNCTLRYNAMGFPIVDCIHQPTRQALEEESK